MACTQCSRLSIVVAGGGKNPSKSLNQLQMRVEALRVKDLAPHEILVKVQAAAVSQQNLSLLLSDKQKELMMETPFIAGTEFAGTVMEVGESVTSFSQGDAILGTSSDGAITTHALVDESACQRLPEGFSYEMGTCWIEGYVMAYKLLVERGGLSKEDRMVLITDAASLLGFAAVQVAKAIGCQVVAIVDAKEKSTRVKALTGAEYVFDVDTSPSYSVNVDEITNYEGVDVVLDLFGDQKLEESIRSASPLGKVLIVDNPGEEKRPNCRELISMNSIKTINCCSNKLLDEIKTDKQRSRNKLHKTLVNWASCGLIKPNVSHSFSLTKVEVVKAYGVLARRADIGSVAVRTGPLAELVPYEVDGNL